MFRPTKDGRRSENEARRCARGASHFLAEGVRGGPAAPRAANGERADGTRSRARSAQPTSDNRRDTRHRGARVREAAMTDSTVEPERGMKSRRLFEALG